MNAPGPDGRVREYCGRTCCTGALHAALQIKEHYPRAQITRLVERANRENPDLVLITGDFIDGRLSDDMFAPLNDIKAPVFFVPGNHEEYVGMDEFIAHLSRTKAVPLCQKKVDLGNIVLAGIDFDWNSRGLEEMVARVAPANGKYSILMSHGPPAFDAARTAGFDLTLSGHTLPFGRPRLSDQLNESDLNKQPRISFDNSSRPESPVVLGNGDDISLLVDYSP